MTLYGFGIIGLITGLLIGTNPVVISSFVAFIKSLIGNGESNNKYTMGGFLFLIFYVVFILFFSVVVSSILLWFSPAYQLTFIIAISLIAIVYSLGLIRRYFWQEPLIKPSKKLTSVIHDKTTKKRGLLNILALALVTAYATIPSLGIVISVLGGISVIVSPNALIWGLPFVFGLATPIYIVLALLSSGTKPSAIIAWKENTKGTMRLYNGLAILAVTWLMLLLVATGGVLDI